jgi:uncharacterized heparinase superfamily protein
LAERAGPLARALRLWHTVRWLRPVQVWGRAWFLLHRPKPYLRPAPPLRARAAEWQRCAREPSQLGPTRFRFLGVERDIAGEGAPAWDRRDWPRLWRYNLHYFDDLAADGADSRIVWHRALIESWIEHNRVGQGTGWEPYPLSLRLVNWIKAAHLVRGGVVQSLAVQARWLTGRLEIHLLGNHLWANAKALVFAGTFFEGEEAREWRERGLAILRRELREQILPDGGHFERSPMYHAILLEDVLDLLQLGRCYPGVFEASDVADWRETAARMLRWLRVMTHPDGGIAFFNDAALSVAPSLAALREYAERGAGLRAAEAGAADPKPRQDGSLAAIEVLPDSGYVRLQAGSAVLIADVGPVGPDYLPGHAHADTLSFELSIGGRRMLVNSGTSTYEAGAERLRQRGTPAHNTVTIDGQDSSEVWSSFRVARRARPLDVAWGEEGGRPWLRAAHDGYTRLPGRPLHRREFALSAGDLVVTDRIEGAFRAAEARFHFHPDADPEMLSIDAPHIRWEPATWHPRFGASVDNQAVVVPIAPPGEVITRFRWSD